MKSKTTIKGVKALGNLFLTAGVGNEPNVAAVCFIGIGVVFAGLVLIIGLVELMTFICNKLTAKANGAVKAPQAAQPQQVQSTAIENRGEIIAAVCAAVAEENGTDISAIRVISFKKV